MSRLPVRALSVACAIGVGAGATAYATSRPVSIPMP